MCWSAIKKPLTHSLPSVNSFSYAAIKKWHNNRSHFLLNYLVISHKQRKSDPVQTFCWWSEAVWEAVCITATELSLASWIQRSTETRWQRTGSNHIMNGTKLLRLCHSLQLLLTYVINKALWPPWQRGITNWGCPSSHPSPLCLLSTLPLFLSTSLCPTLLSLSPFIPAFPFSGTPYLGSREHHELPPAGLGRAKLPNGSIAFWRKK